jgi:methanogenic corrinoid protein MtbC1
MLTSDNLLSPKDLAVAIGSSESSLKRWIDRGLLRVSRTAGGHRRIAVSEAIRFVRSRKMPIVQPEILGLPASVGVKSRLSLDGARSPNETFSALLRAGHDVGARAHLLNRFLAGETIAELADGPIRTSLIEIGELWHDSVEGILIEHRATEICVELIQELKKLVQPVSAVFRSIGGAIDGDVYKIPPLLASAVIQENGIQAVNLGTNTPIAVFEIACLCDDLEQRPDIVWMSVNCLSELAMNRDAIERFAVRCASEDIAVVIGGRLANELDIDHISSIEINESMQEFSAFLERFKAAII